MSERRCPTPGRSYGSAAEAEDAILTIKLNRAGTRQVVHEGDYGVRRCRCGRFHVLTRTQLDKSRRKVTRRGNGQPPQAR